VGAVDDVEVVEEGGEEGGIVGGDEMDVDQAEGGAEKGGAGGEVEKDVEAEAVSGPRIRYLSVLEVAVSSR
jgi:hypothetical protein